MIARQNPQAARVVRNALAQPELRGEIRDANALRFRMSAPEPTRAFQVILEVLVHTVHVREERFIGFQFDQTPLIDAPQHQPGIVIGLFPEVGVDPSKNFDGRMVPRPAQIQGQIVETAQPLR
jgi:hypothetical protein